MFLGVRRRQTQKNDIRPMKIGKRAHALELAVGIHGMPLGRKPPPQLIADHAARDGGGRGFFVHYVPHYMFAPEKAWALDALAPRLHLFYHLFSANPIKLSSNIN